MDPYVDLFCQTAEGMKHFTLWSSEGPRDSSLARRIAHATATQRLSLGHLSATDSDEMERYRAGGAHPPRTKGKDDLAWGFPGDTSDLVELARERLGLA